MAGIVKAVVTFEHVSGLPKDRVSNSFAFSALSPATDIDPDVLSVDIYHFYFSDNTANPVGYYLSPELSRESDSAVIKIYDIDAHLDGSAAGPPIFQTTFTLPDPSISGGLPAEVAAVMTTRAFDAFLVPIEQPDADAPPDGKVDRPRQRSSGRVFIGPLVVETMATVSGVPRLTAQFRTDVLDAAERLWDEALVDDAEWVVWSRKDSAVRSLKWCEMDDAYDTVRARGPQATLREQRLVNP